MVREAAIVVSGDRHLLDVGECRRIRLLTPAAFVALRAGARSPNPAEAIAPECQPPYPLLPDRSTASKKTSRRTALVVPERRSSRLSRTPINVTSA